MADEQPQTAEHTNLCVCKHVQLAHEYLRDRRDDGFPVIIAVGPCLARGCRCPAYAPLADAA